ncbi:rust resistance kinase Lr10-like [Trifolium pratense]|uniref:rust resistance kinase Lr10-like n=1 Tax=Trifolium pratense TaxID=57577 RepID=UPI001E6979E9|nr:rust resistance kinase Lr10-like [Trifolium pratense]
MWWMRVILVLLFPFLLILQQGSSSTIEQEHTCQPSSCGKISSISYPFRLTDDLKHCGDNRYELSCENNVTTLYLYSAKYHVQSINYNNFTIRLVDPGVQESNCSSLPLNFLSQSNFCDTYELGKKYCMDPYQALGYYGDELVFEHIVYLNCSHQVTNNHKYVNTTSCLDQNSEGYYIYAMAGDLIAQDFQVGCHVKLVTPTSWLKNLERNQEISSYDFIHKALVYGFEISWLNLPCKNLQCGDSIRCIFNSNQKVLCYDRPCNKSWGGMTLFIALLICKWRKRHLSIFEYIEIYLQQQNNLMPIGYSYKEIKKMAKGFKDKLGEGGFGTVFKGNLRSGPCVAIKMLAMSKGNGQDFISEVATIGRIHHLNVVQLIGFCAEGSKRALVYEFMPNGSLDKFIFSKEGSKNISYSQIFDISIGVARGIAYLHHGCEMKILHFDIKPHNILLDENFTPKVSDFGLAKLYSVENSIITMTAARGTIGYMAPELFYQNIGGVSYKADVYSFGMLLMEMANKRKNLNAKAERSSQLYFPLWIYDQVEKGKDIEMEDTTEEEKKIVKKMIIVALWCIQLKPDDRPSMNNVVEMLQGNIESLNIPPKPTLYPDDTITNDERNNFDQRSSSNYTSSYDSVEISTNSLVENIA